jgi:hypothetical protein
MTATGLPVSAVTPGGCHQSRQRGDVALIEAVAQGSPDASRSVSGPHARLVSAAVW